MDSLPLYVSSKKKANNLSYQHHFVLRSPILRRCHSRRRATAIDWCSLRVCVVLGKPLVSWQFSGLECGGMWKSEARGFRRLLTLTNCLWWLSLSTRLNVSLFAQFYPQHKQSCDKLPNVDELYLSCKEFLNEEIPPCQNWTSSLENLIDIVNSTWYPLFLPGFP